MSEQGKKPLRFGASSARRRPKLSIERKPRVVREALGVGSIDRALLRKAVCRAAQFFLDQDRAVHLPGLGVLLPVRATQMAVREEEGQDRPPRCRLCSETYRTIKFEKCCEVTAYHRRRFAPLVEIEELARRLPAHLPVEQAALLLESEGRAHLRELMKHLCYEIVAYGHSSQLEPLGHFYALHNRQGMSLRDWYAGADIFIRPAYRELLESGPSRVFEPPVYQDAWEPFRAAYGDPLAVFSLVLREELEKLGYQLPRDMHPEIRVAVFEGPRTGGSRVLKYCTDGLRTAASAHGTGAGTEFVFQTTVDCREQNIPLWPGRALALGWLLLEGSKRKAVGLGVGLGAGMRLYDHGACRLNLIFTTRFAPLPRELRSANGRFAYVNLLGITEAEAALARRFSPQHLTVLLEHRKLDQITKPRRACLVSRSGFLKADLGEQDEHEKAAEQASA